MELSREVKAKARELGAVEAGICSALALPHNKASIDSILPGCRSVLCIAFPHSETALASSDPYVKQYDTIFCYDEVARISHQLARFLESRGHRAVAVPAFLPLDMSDGNMGMVGAVDWRTAAVESGMGVRGKSGLVVTRSYGPRIRLGGVVTTADLKADRKLVFSPCENCHACLKSCPVDALSRDGMIDRKRCGEHIFSYGLRAFTRLLAEVGRAGNEAAVAEAVYSHRTRELWQALETGNYYHCWTCQSCCPVGGAAQTQQKKTGSR